MPKFSKIRQIEKKSMNENAVLRNVLEELHFFRKFMLGCEFLQSIYDIEQMNNFPGERMVL